LEWQRDDRLGRSWQWQQFEHGREILRGIRFVANSNANGNSYRHSQSNTDRNANRNRYFNPDSNGNTK
jgi:hypothetical protein